MASQSEQEVSLAELPGLMPPPGVTPNFVNPYSRVYLATFTITVTLTVTTLFILIRTYTKYAINKIGLRWDDYLSILAWMLFIAYEALANQVRYYGAFVHQWNVPLLRVIQFLKLVNYAEILYNPVMLATKLSIMVQIMYIFASTREGATYYICQTFIWINVLFYAMTMFVTIFGCNPRAKAWEPMLPGHCVNLVAADIANAAVNVISDFVLLLLPIVCVWKLQMPRKHKIGLSAVFATAGFACISSIMRLVTSIQMVGNDDITWAIMNEALWTLGEISSGIICGCMPTIPQFFRHFVPKIRTHFTSRTMGDKISQVKSSIYTKQSDRVRAGSKGGTSDYVDLEGEGCEMELFNASGRGLNGWIDEVNMDSDGKDLGRGTVGEEVRQ